MSYHRYLAALAIVAIIAMPQVASAQAEKPTATGQLELTTPYPQVAIEAGDQATFDLEVTAPEPVEASLEAVGVPADWSSSFRGGGFEIDAVTAGPTPADVRFDVTVPPDVADATFDITVRASSVDNVAELPLQVRVSAQAGGDVTLAPDFPGLRAPAGETVTFDVELRNGTPADLQFELDSTGPAGWDVTAQPASEPQAATLQVASGSSQTIAVEVTSPARAEAGQYGIVVQASAPDFQVEAEMIVEVVGSFSMNLLTADQRLNAEVSVGGSSDLDLLVTNTGTAPLRQVELSASAPSGWDVTFSESTIISIPAGESAPVKATVAPSDEAIAGDYLLTLTARSEQASSTVDIRTSVNPSALWGFVGIGLIALTLAGLAYVFRRFGRR